MSQTNTNTDTRPVTSTRAITLEEVDGAKEALAIKAAAVAETIAETVQLVDVHLKGKWEMVLFPNSQSLKVDNELLNTKGLLMLYQYSEQTKDTDLSTMSFVGIPSY